MALLQGVIFIEIDINTRKITFLRTDTVTDYDTNTTNIYMQAVYKDSNGDKTYLSSKDIANYGFTLYALKPVTNNAYTIDGVITDELKEQIHGGLIKFVIPKSCTNRHGVVKCELHINKEKEMIASTRFILDVKQSLVTEFNDVILEDYDFGVLQQLILDVQKVNNIDDTEPRLTTTYSSNKIERIKGQLSLQIKEKADISTTNNIQQQVNNLVLGAVGDGNNAEVVQARGIYDTLNDRIMANENNLNDIENVCFRDSVNELDSSWIDGAETINGISVTYNIDGTITLNGTATSSTIFYDQNKSLSGAGKIFTIRKVRGTTTGKVRGRLNIDSSTFKDVILDETTDIASVNLDDATYTTYRVYINNGVTLNDYTISMQVEYSEDGSIFDYEPYGSKIVKVADEDDIKSIVNDINSVKTDINSVKTDINSVKTDINSVKTDINILNRIVKKNVSKRYLYTLTKPYLCLVADDGSSNLTDVTIPILKSKNVPCTFALWSKSNIVTSNISGLQEMVENYGCGVAQHGAAKLVDDSGNSLKSDSELISFFDNETSVWTSYGINVNSFVFPYHNTNDDLKSIASIYFSFMASGSNSQYKYYLNSNRSNIFELSRISLVSNTLAELKTKLDYAIANNMLMIVYWHDDTLANDSTKQTLLGDFIDYAKTTNINFITLNDLENI